MHKNAWLTPTTCIYTPRSLSILHTFTVVSEEKESYNLPCAYAIFYFSQWEDILLPIFLRMGFGFSNLAIKTL